MREAKAAFSGEGARLAGGRWNEVGTAVVYVSGSLALAALETFVHLRPLIPKQRFVFFTVSIPNTVRIERSSELPSDWRISPAPQETQRLGTEWVKAARSAVLEVPSAVIPTECNYMLNPAHPDFKRIKLSEPRSFSFDPRLWKR